MRKTVLTKKEIERNYDKYRCLEIESMFEESQWIEITQCLHNRHKGNLESMKSEIYRDIEGYGVVRKVWTANSGFRLLPEHVKIVQGHYKGKLRPEHSEKMKAKTPWNKKGPDRSDNQKRYLDQMNSPSWKKRVLENKGINLPVDFDDLEINKIYSEFRKKITKSPEYKLSCVQGFLDSLKYAGMYNVDVVDSLYRKAKKGDSKSLDTLYRLRNSLKSVRALELNDNMGTYKSTRTKINTENLTSYAGNRSTLSFRSSWELELMYFLEAEYIPWEYESVTFNIGNMHYTPDFKISIRQKDYFLEVKGAVYSDMQVEKQQSKFRGVYTRDNFIFLDTIKDLSIKNLLQNINMVIYKKTHERLEDVQEPENYLGRSRDSILQTLEKETVFINDGWYLHVIKEDYIESWVVTANRCKSYLKVNYQGEIVEHVTDTTSIGAIHIDWLENQKIELLKAYKLKNNTNGSQD
jgi:hypothetical protein